VSPCYSTLKNDYRQYDIDLEIIHHSELINKLIKEGRLKLHGNGELGKVMFHDSCYLGRYNGIYKAPREAISSVIGRAPTEMERCYERSFCCGAGGGRMWMEEAIGRRINLERIQEAIAPYTRFVRAEREKMREMEGRFKELKLEIGRLKGQLEKM
jgi:Fe-S oxidoreductase